jgi:hypothetical protein
MQFVAWQRPGRIELELRTISRHIVTLTDEHTRLSNRLHAAEVSETTPRCVRQDLKHSIHGLKKLITRLRKAALALEHYHSYCKATNSTPRGFSPRKSHPHSNVPITPTDNALVEQNETLMMKFKQLIGIPGIAETSALQLLGEFVPLDPQMTARQWVAHSATRSGPPGFWQVDAQTIAHQPTWQPLS